MPYHDDPIQNRSLSDQCWDMYHYRRLSNGDTVGCTGWRLKCNRCVKVCAPGCFCRCHDRCECWCHERQPKKKKIHHDTASTMDIMDTGCGTIEIK